MNIPHLRYFVAMMELRSVSRAAARMGIAQPTMSAALKRLEADFGVRLFAPDGRGLRPLPAAERLVGHARVILRALGDAQADLSGGRETVLRIGIAPTLAQAWLAEILACFDGQVEIVEASPEVLSGSLRRGTLETTLTILPQDWSADAELIEREPFCLFVSKSHPLAARTCIAVEMLRDQPFVLRQGCERAGSARRLLEALRLRLRIIARTEQEAVAARLVALGLGVTLAPAGWGYSGLAALDVEGLTLSRLVGIAWQGDRGKAGADRLLRHIRQRTSPRPVEAQAHGAPEHAE